MCNFFSTVLIWFSSWTIADVQVLTDILQNLTLTGATFVAAWWAFATFGLKERTDELLVIARKIFEIHSHIEGSISTYNLHKILASLGAPNEKKLAEVKQGAEVRLMALHDELNELQQLSLRIPITFRLLKLSEYQLELIGSPMLDGIERWSEKDTKERLMKAKSKILNEIYTEINKHGNFLRKIQIRVQNTIYRVKNIGSSIK